MQSAPKIERTLNGYSYIAFVFRTIVNSLYWSIIMLYQAECSTNSNICGLPEGRRGLIHLFGLFGVVGTGCSYRCRASTHQHRKSSRKKTNPKLFNNFREDHVSTRVKLLILWFYLQNSSHEHHRFNITNRPAKRHDHKTACDATGSHSARS
jgi:hypothetical protein